MLRDQPGRVFTEADQDLARELANSIAAFLDHAESFATAKQLRNQLVEELSSVIERWPDDPIRREQACAVIESATGPATLIDADRRFLAASPAFLRLIGAPEMDLRGVPVPGLADSGPLSDREVFDRLWRGGLDSICLTRTRHVPAGALELDLHWSVVRTQTSTPVYLVVTHSCRSAKGAHQEQVG